MPSAPASKFDHHHRETPSPELAAIYARLPYDERKKALADLLLRLDITYAPDQLIPVSFLPRVLPRPYFATIEASGRALTQVLFSALYDAEFRNGPLRKPGLNAALEAIGVFDRLPARIVGGARYDFAIEGPLTPDNPPRILEVNDLDYAGAGWISTSHRALMQVVPEIASVAVNIEQPRVVGHHMARLGKRILQVTADGPDSATDYTLFRKDVREMTGVEITGIEDLVFAEEAREGRIHFTPKGVSRGTEMYDALYFRTMGTVEEMEEYHDVVKRIVASGVPTYDGFAQLLMENKGLWSHLHDACDRLVDRQTAALLRKVLVPTQYMTPTLLEEVRHAPERYVLKRADGHMGRTVYVGEEALAVLGHVTSPPEWCVQQRIELNTMRTDPTTSGPVESIIDLGVYVVFEWDESKAGADRLVRFEVAGLLTRSSPDNPKVNVALGGCVVPVFVAKS
ncbi:MAG: hypothetical protein AAB434_11270 [Planctomycetota bacterium]